MEIIDIHTHVFPDHIAHKVIPDISKKADWPAQLDGTVGDLRRSMRKAGVTRSVVQPVATKPAQVRSINNWVASIADDEIISFGSFHPDFENFEDEITRIKGLGLKGLKIHPEYQQCWPDDEAFYPIYDELVENDMIVLFHCGVDLGVPPPLHSSPRAIASIMGRFPDLKVIGAHLGGYQQWDEVEEYLIGKNIYLETSFAVGHIDDDRFVKLVREHGIDRVLFGTDSPWKDQKSEVEKIFSLDLSSAEKERILSINAHALLQM